MIKCFNLKRYLNEDKTRVVSPRKNKPIATHAKPAKSNKPPKLRIANINRRRFPLASDGLSAISGRSPKSGLVSKLFRTATTMSMPWQPIDAFYWFERSSWKEQNLGSRFTITFFESLVAILFAKRLTCAHPAILSLNIRHRTCGRHSWPNRLVQCTFRNSGDYERCVGSTVFSVAKDAPNYAGQIVSGTY